MKRALVLGGTLDARHMASALVKAGWSVELALKGLTARPVIPAGVTHREGGFGGGPGLAAYLDEANIDLLIDATHPFAAGMSHNAHQAAQLRPTRLMRLERPGWHRRPGDRWTEFDGLYKAVLALKSRPASNILLALGGQGAELFRALPQHRFLARVLSSSKTDLATSYGHRWRGLSLQRFSGSPTLAQEMETLRQFQAQVLIMRNAGGPMDAKLQAARRMNLPVWLIKRPKLPPVPTYVSHLHLMEALTRGQGVS